MRSSSSSHRDYKVVTKLSQSCDKHTFLVVTTLWPGWYKVVTTKNFGFETVSTLSQPYHNYVATFFVSCSQPCRYNYHVTTTKCVDDYIFLYQASYVIIVHEYSCFTVLFSSFCTSNYHTCHWLCQQEWSCQLCTFSAHILLLHESVV